MSTSYELSQRLLDEVFVFSEDEETGIIDAEWMDEDSVEELLEEHRFSTLHDLKDKIHTKINDIKNKEARSIEEAIWQQAEEAALEDVLDMIDEAIPEVK